MRLDDHSENLTIRREREDVMNVSSMNTNRYGPSHFRFHEDFKFTAKSAAIDKEESWRENYGST
jgi:hypothetical protein